MMLGATHHIHDWVAPEYSVIWNWIVPINNAFWSPCPPWLPHSAFCLWRLALFDNTANSEYCLTLGSFCCLFLKPIRENAQHPGKAQTSRGPFERMITPIMVLVEGTVVPEWGRRLRGCAKLQTPFLPWMPSDGEELWASKERQFNHRDGQRRGMDGLSICHVVIVGREGVCSLFRGLCDESTMGPSGSFVSVYRIARPRWRSGMV